MLIAIATVFLYFLTYGTIQLINYNFKRKDLMRVMRWYEYKYVKKAMFKNIKKYLGEIDSRNTTILSFAIMFLQFVVLLNNLQYLVFGGNFLSLVASACLTLNLFLFFVLYKQKTNVAHLLENYFWTTMLYITQLVFLPTLAYLMSPKLVSIFSLILLPVSIFISYQVLRMVRRTPKYKFSNLLGTMFVSLLLLIQYTFVFYNVTYSTTKLVLVWLHVVLTCAILFSFQRNIVDLKVNYKTKSHLLLIGIYATLTLTFMFGSILWQ